MIRLQSEKTGSGKDVSYKESVMSAEGGIVMTEEEAWAAVNRRDRHFDGAFVYAVSTTGIYCRPSCPARRPHRENVTFYPSPLDAEKAGYRACRRCRPADPRGTSAEKAVEKARAYIEAHLDKPLTLDVSSPFGRLLVAVTERGVCAVSLGDDDHVLADELQDEFPNARAIERDDEALRTWVQPVVRYLEGIHAHLTVPLDLQGTDFQRRVWKALQEIPYGETRTYGDIAAGIGQPSAARAVAQACAGNRIALLVPCHRVVRKDGSAGGYRWGSERKARLLQHERQIQEQDNGAS